MTFIVREVTGDAINEQGLSITEGEQTVRVQPHISTSIAQTFIAPDANFDLIILGMKAYDLADAINHLVAFCPEPPPILTLQNGIGVERPLIEQFGADNLIIGALTTPVSKTTNSQILVERADRGLTIAPAVKGKKVQQWDKLLNDAGVPTESLPDYQSMKWSKAFLNIVGNATAAILNRPPGVIYKSDSLFDLEKRMLRETLAVMNASRLKSSTLPGSPATKICHRCATRSQLLLKPILTNVVTKGRGDKMPSFQIDLMAGRGQNRSDLPQRCYCQSGPRPQHSHAGQHRAHQHPRRSGTYKNSTGATMTANRLSCWRKLNDLKVISEQCSVITY